MEKKFNPKHIECKEKWLNKNEFQAEILDKIGEVSYLEVRDVIKHQNKTITYRYINEATYDESISQSGHRIRYIQLFADGKNLGWCEDHPKMTLKELEDGRKIWIGNPTIYYDFILNAYELDIHRIGTLNVWLKK